MRTVSDRLKNRDYELIIDASSSMDAIDKNGKSRWENVQEVTKGIAGRISRLDPDGIVVSVFSTTNRTFENVGPEQVDKIFTEREPMGSTAMHIPLKERFEAWKKQKRNGQLKDGTTFIVITDGDPDDKAAVVNVIKEVTQHMDKDEEIGVAFYQIGNDPAARKFLKQLDDDLEGNGAKFDIVDTKTFDELGSMSLTEALIAAIDD